MEKAGFTNPPPAYGTCQPAISQQVQVCAIMFASTDLIRLIGVPSPLTPYIRTAIIQGWGKIQREQNYYGSHEFKCLGNPFLGIGQEAVRARRLLVSLLRTMASSGWNLIQSTDVSKKKDDKDTLYFEYSIPDPDVQMFSMSLNMSDRIRVIDAPGFMPLVKQAIQSQWNLGIQQEREYHGSLEVKLNGNPWFANGSETVKARMLLAQVFSNFRAVGFKLYASVDISIGTEGEDVESFVFRKVGPSWQ